MLHNRHSSKVENYSCQAGFYYLHSICLVTRTFKTDSSDFESYHASNLHANNEKLRDIMLITV